MDEGPKYGRGIHAYMAHSSLLPNPDRARIIFSFLYVSIMTHARVGDVHRK
jgi:hypothetical protein